MAMVKKDAANELRMMQEEMNRLFELSRSRLSGERLHEGVWQPATDITEDERQVVVKMDLPEVDQEDIDVRLEEGRLLVEGERKSDAEENRAPYRRIERPCGTFRRAFALPEDIHQEEITARCERGVLTIVLPKRVSAER